MRGKVSYTQLRSNCRGITPAYAGKRWISSPVFEHGWDHPRVCGEKPQEEELAEKSARLAELNAQLDVDEKSHEPEQEEEPDEDASRRPSVLAALEEKSDKPEPVKPFRSYYDKDGDAR